MTEEAADQSFGQFMAAGKALAVYGSSEEFEDDQQFTRVSSNSALEVIDLPGVTASDPHVHVIPTHVQIYLPSGAGKTCLLLRNFAKGSPESFNALPILPVQATVTSDSPESLNAVTQGASMASEPALITEDQSVDEIIRRIRTTLSASYSVKLADRLAELQDELQEELNGDGLEVSSLLHFAEFMETCPELRCPAVSLTPDRDIYASWKSTPDRVFSIHFLPNGKARFVIFYPNSKHVGEIIRLSGIATVDTVMSVAAPHRVLDWVTDEGRRNSSF